MSRILVCSDIHGEYHRFGELLKEAEHDSKKDTLVILGDFIDRGFNSVWMIRLLYNMSKVHNNLVVLSGNHENMFIRYREDSYMKNWFLKNGGVELYYDFPKLKKWEQEQLIEYLEGLPLYYETEDYIFVHGGIEQGKHPSETDEEILLWDREFIAKPTKLSKVVVFGHTPTESGKIEFMDDKIGIDCGAGYGGNLGLLELPSGKTYYK